MANGFMVDEITEKKEWIVAETLNGEVYHIPAEYFDFSEEEYVSTEQIKGFGARIQAPGYLDSTEWTVFDTEEQARKYLHETYHDDHHEDYCATCDEQLENCQDDPCSACVVQLSDLTH